MRYQEIVSPLFEQQYVVVDQTSYQELFQKSRKYINEIKKFGDCLYRGHGYDDNDASHYLDGDNGLPFPRLYEQAVHEWFKTNALGVGRKDVAYCGPKSMAANYGKLYGVFPANDFKFTWSPNVEDLYHIDLVKAVLHRCAWGAYLPPSFGAFAIYGDYFDQTQNEHMIEKVKLGDWWLESDINKHIAAGLTDIHRWDVTKRCIDQACDGLGYRTDDLVGALKSRNEVMMTSSVIYLLPVNQVDDFLDWVEENHY